MKPDADELVRRYLLRHYLQRQNMAAGGSRQRRESHVLNCPELHVASVESGEDVNDTGQGFTWLTATIECPHGTRDEYRHDAWGDLDDLYRDIASGERDR